MASINRSFGEKDGSVMIAIFSATLSLVLFSLGVTSGGGWFELLQGIGMISYLICIYAIINEIEELMVPALIWTIILPIPIIITHILFVVAHVNRFVELQQMLEDKNLVRKKRLVLEQERDYIPVAITVMSIAYILVAALCVYFWRVLYALYKVFKNPSRDTMNLKLDIGY